MTRDYAAHAQPLWKRVLLTPEAAVLGLLLVVVLYANARVPNFSGPLTLPFLILDAAPILGHPAAWVERTAAGGIRGTRDVARENDA